MKRLKLSCNYCEGAGPTPGTLWTDNNGPIVDCPICNDHSPSARRQREFEAAERQRKDSSRLTSTHRGSET